VHCGQEMAEKGAFAEGEKEVKTASQFVKIR
jgi:hypothetical protein